MAKPPEITSHTIMQVMQSQDVQDKLHARARMILPRAQQEAAKAGRMHLAKALKIEAGTRPGIKAGGFKRPTVKVIAHYPEDLRKKDKGAKLGARAIIRRAARG